MKSSTSLKEFDHILHLDSPNDYQFELRNINDENKYILDGFINKKWKMLITQDQILMNKIMIR